MAMCVMAVVAVAPCQCFSLGAIETTSPGRISSIGPPQRCARPQPAVTIKVWPSGWVCQAVRAPGSKVTIAPPTRAGSSRWKRESMRTVPVKYSAGPLPDGCEPMRLMSIMPLLCSSLVSTAPVRRRRHEQPCAGGTAEAGHRDHPAHRPGRAVGEDADQGRADDAAAILDGADQRRDGARMLRMIRHG